MLGASAPLKWTQQGADLSVTLPSALPGNYAWVLRLTPSQTPAK